MINVRRAQLVDVPQMMPLLEEYARQAEILSRTESDVYRSIREWVVAENEIRIVGMGSLLVMGYDLAEIRSMVVNPAFHGQGVGRGIVEMLVDDARTLELARVFALTRKPGFFMKMGFELTKIEKLPRKVKHDCVFCPKFHACDEVALIKYLKNAKTAVTIDVPQTEPVSKNGVNPTPVIPLMFT